LTAATDDDGGGSQPVSQPPPSAARGGLADRLRAGQPLVCGIVNVTPDSFFEAGRRATLAGAIGSLQH